MSRSVRFRVLEMSETACLGILTRMELLERALVALVLEESVQRTKACCSAECSCVMIAASMVL